MLGAFLFRDDDIDKKVKVLSGGERSRLALIKLLLEPFNVLVIDEPTNHLDIESIQWMEEFLYDYRGAVIIISHDRAFLDNITSRTIEISLSRIYDYRVPYSKYTILREEHRSQQLAAYKNQQKIIADTNRFIERFRYKATKAAQVQSRIKQLEKMDRIEIDEEDISSIHIRFPAAPRSGNIIFNASGLSKNYGEKNVIDSIDFIISRGERIAFIGKNGGGKTTLSRILVSDIDFKGSLKVGHNVKIGYFAQNQDEQISSGKDDYLEKKAFLRTLRKITKEITDCESDIEHLENELKKLTDRFRSPESLTEDQSSHSRFLKYEKQKNELDSKMKKWEQLLERLAELKKSKYYSVS